jgi:pyruvate/2-oxoglutarate/acetoin dehydrogenase E1 component
VRRGRRRGRVLRLSRCSVSSHLSLLPAEIAAIVMEEAFDFLDAPVERITGTVAVCRAWEFDP